MVWDFGQFRTEKGTEADVYDQLKSGRLEATFSGVRVDGVLRFSKEREGWKIDLISGILAGADYSSILSGLTLEEVCHPRGDKRYPLYVSLNWDHFYTDRTDRPQVVVDKRRVVDLNFVARTKGIAESMQLQHVLPLIPDCVVKELQPQTEKKHRWLESLLTFSDTIQPTADHSAIVDLSVHPDPQHIAGRLIATLALQPFGQLRFGVGPSAWIAHLAAQQKWPFSFLRRAGHALSNLPTSLFLAVEEKDRQRLRDLGFETIGDIADVPIDTLRLQFGESAYRISAAAKGKTVDRVVPSYPPESILSTLAFSTPLNDAEQLHLAIKDLSNRLAQRLDGRQASEIVLLAEHESGQVVSQSRSCHRPVHTPDRLMALLSYLASEFCDGSPDIVRLTARLDNLVALKSTQQHMFALVSKNKVDHAMAALKDSLGQQSVVLGKEIVIPRREQVLKAWRNATGWN